MAIDTAAKRKSVAGVGFHVALGIAPNASKPQGWRQSVAYSYFGIDAASPVTRVPSEVLYADEQTTTIIASDQVFTIYGTELMLTLEERGDE